MRLEPIPFAGAWAPAPAVTFIGFSRVQFNMHCVSVVLCWFHHSPKCCDNDRFSPSNSLREHPEAFYSFALFS
jgi:hypothetical protein